MRFTLTLTLVLVVCLWAQDKPAATVNGFHGTYAQLQPAQKKLVDEWYDDYNKMMGENLPPSDYNQLALSIRTTFEAVTHALQTTELTDKSGQPLSNALNLVQAIETINGKVPKARGDLQFRMYVVLKPDALQTLRDSREFFRDRDNTVFHHGYPLNYRQNGGTPSIQVSMANDGRHADIDVDYRSAKFPQALFNGHLTAANSDVRAGNNTQRHLVRWQGLTDWWRNLFGLADEQDDSEAAAKASEVPPIPRKGTDKLETAIYDYLNSWLVEQKPELAAAYLSSRSFACLTEYGSQAGQEINAGTAPYVAAREMAATSKLIGRPPNLEAAVAAAAINDSSLKPVKQRYSTVFALYQVPNAVAADFECDPVRAFNDYDNARVTKASGRYGRYYGSVFQLKPMQGRGDTITMLWAKDGKYWKIVAWDVEPEDSKLGEIPDTRRNPSSDVTAEAHAKGDPAFLQASHAFLHSWLVTDNFASAESYFSPRCYECVNSYLGPGEAPPKTPQEYANYLRSSLTTIGKDLGPVHHLREAVEPVAPEHADLKVVDHPAKDPYTLVAVPDSLASTFLCEKVSPQHPYSAAAEAQPKTFGNYYALVFALRTPGDHPAALTFLWAKENGQWKIVAYELDAP